MSLTAAVVLAARESPDSRTRMLSVATGIIVLPLAAFAVSRQDTPRGEWSRDLGSGFDVTCSFTTPAPETTDSKPWLMLDLEIAGGANAPPRVLLNDRVLETPVATMPDFPLAAYRGQRDPRAFRRIWRVALPEDPAWTRDARIRVEGAPGDRIFGDVRAEGPGPWLSRGEWPNLSVYRLMHEGQYRLPVFEERRAPCASTPPGAPGIDVVFLRTGSEGTFTRPPARAASND